MLISEILNEQTGSFKTISILPGRFQPPHKGHLDSWDWLRRKFGTAFIATSDKVELPKSPFNFNEKKTLLSFAGIPSSNIIQVKNPYIALELVEKYDEDKTIVIFGVSEKDKERFPFKPKKDGSPGYFQPYEKNKNNLQPRKHHGYIVVVPTVEFNVLGQPLRSATEFREKFASSSNDIQMQMIEDLYGKYSDSIHKLLTRKLIG